jgi:DNA ligase (NAD+)
MNLEVEIKEIESNPTKYANNISIDNLIIVLKKLAHHYYNTGNALVSDEIYDILINVLEIRDPTNDYIKQIGAPITKDAKLLPYYMASLDKIKPDTDLLTKWQNKYTGPYVISDKLDGVSGLIYKTNDNTIKLFTRGDGTRGQDITHLIPYILPKNVKFDKMPKLSAVRGEIIISKNNFEKLNKNKTKDKYKNARNTVAGMVNSKDITKRLDIVEVTDFIAYAVISPELSQVDQMMKIKEWGFPIVNHLTQKNKLNNATLSQLLINRRDSGIYDVDGLVVYDSSKSYGNVNKNPENGFAFKTVLTDQVAEAVVIDVLWDVSKHGYLKPRVKIQPINLVGVVINYATAFNAKFIKDNVLGPGSIIEIVRSGDVIPFIREIKKPSSSNKPRMPDTPYKWNDTGVDIIVQDIHGDRQNRMIVKQITYFFKVLEVKFISEGIVTKFVDNGYNTVTSIIQNKNKLAQIDGIGDKLVDKIFKNIEESFKSAELYHFLASGTMFGRGFGKRKTKLITDAYPNIMNEKWTKDMMISKIKEIDGFDTLTATRFTNNFDKFVKFFNELDKVIGLKHIKTVHKPVIVSNNLFKDHRIVFSGTRNKEWEDMIDKNGGKVSTGISKNTTILVYTDATTSKYKKAIDLGITTYTYDEFQKHFNL